MLISEAIAQLEDLKKEHGDLEVLAWRDTLMGFTTTGFDLGKIVSKNDLELIRNDLHCTSHVNLKIGDYYVEAI